MSKQTDQMKHWSGDFGKQYTQRNDLTPAGMDQLYRDHYGLSRSELNREFLDRLPRDLRILEVGSNVGLQLALLQRAGFADLTGIELQWYGVEEGKKNTRGINLMQGSAFDLPFRDGWFDLVFTSGVLIHIHPHDLPAAMSEIVRCSRRYVWGMEYYAPEHTEIPYRGESNLMWKGDFARLYLERFPELEVVTRKRVKYTANDNEDEMFLLRKKGT
ncbi:MAG TPA: methyltransferase domain-containing protein [bacterium]|nr:methyltransferase domain-containing protein [bacterium]